MSFFGDIFKEISKNPKLFRELPEDDRDEYDIVYHAIKAEPSNYMYASENLKKDRDVIQCLLDIDISFFGKLDPELQKNKQVVEDSLRRHSLKFTGFFRQLDESIRDDINLALLTIARDADQYAFLSDRLRDDKLLLRLALLSNVWMYEWASDRLKHDVDILEMVLDRNPIVIASLNRSLLDNRDFALKSVQSNGNMLHFVPDEYKDDEVIVLEAIKTKCSALLHASDRLKDNIHVVSTACLKNRGNYHFASIRLQNYLPLLIRFHILSDPFKIVSIRKV